MYEYCIWRRDEYIASCEAFPTLWAEAVDQVGCKKEEQDGTCKRLNEKVAFTLRPGVTTETNNRKAAEKRLSKRPNWKGVKDLDEMHNDLIEVADGTLGFEASCGDFYEFVDPEYEAPIWSGDEEVDEDSEDGEDGNDADGEDGNDGGDEGGDDVVDGEDGEGDDGSGTCVDTTNGAEDKDGFGCGSYDDFPGWCGDYDDEDFVADEMCCACGGGSTS